MSDEEVKMGQLHFSSYYKRVHGLTQPVQDLFVDGEKVAKFAADGDIQLKGFRRSEVINLESDYKREMLRWFPLRKGQKE